LFFFFSFVLMTGACSQKEGAFKSEIVPLKVKWVDPKTEEQKELIVDVDDGVRDGVTKESLAKLKPAFSKTGSTHAGELISPISHPHGAFEIWQLKPDHWQETLLKYRTALLRSSWLAAVSQSASVSLLSPNLSALRS